MWDRLTCVTPAAAVVTLEAAKSNMLVEHDDDDAKISRLILAAQAVITGPRGIGYAIAASTWRLSLDAFPAVIKIPLDPVTAISEVRYMDPAGIEQTLTAGDDFLVDYDRTPVRIVPAPGASWPTARAQPGAVKVLFTAGADEPPEDLQHAVLLLVDDWYNKPGDDRAVTAANHILARYRDPAL